MSTFPIITLCKIGGSTIATRTDEKLPTAVKILTDPGMIVRAKDIEPEQVAEERENRSHDGNQQNLRSAEQNVVLVRNEVLVGGHRPPVALHHLVDRTHIQRVAADARDHHQDGDDDVEDVRLGNGRQNVPLHALVCFVQQQEQHDPDERVNHRHQQQRNPDRFHRRTAVRASQVFLRGKVEAWKRAARRGRA